MGQTVSAATAVNHGCYKSYKYTHKWFIPYFKKSVTKAAIGSSTTEQFYLEVGKKSYPFQLRLFFHGYNERVENYLSVYLNKNSGDEMLIEFTCAVLNCEGEEIHAKSIKQRMSIENNLGWISYCRRDFLLDDRNKILVDGSLTLNCTIEIFENKAIMNVEASEKAQDPNITKTMSKVFSDTDYLLLKNLYEKNSETVENADDSYINKSLSNVSMDMNQLLLNGDFSDVNLKVEDQVIPVHKAILSARSVVFNKMLKSQLHADSKEIHISDIRAKIMQKMLHYIYSGDIGFIDVDTAQELYYAADKYEVSDLKMLCHTILIHNLDANNAINILLLGYKHIDNELTYASIEYLAKNIAEIQETPKWMLLMKNYSELANIVLKFHLNKPTVKK